MSRDARPQGVGELLVKKAVDLGHHLFAVGGDGKWNAGRGVGVVGHGASKEASGMASVSPRSRA